MHTLLRLEGTPPLPAIAATREYVRALYDTWLGNPELSARVAMAAHELLENVAKYASAEPRRLETEVVRRGARECVRIWTTNAATSERIAMLQGILTELNESADPFDTYVRFITRSSESSEESCLGLARIRAEAGMTLECSVSGSEVTICAEAPLKSGADS